MDSLILMAIGFTLVLLTGRNTLYMHDWWKRSQTEEHPARSWLLRALFTSSGIVLIGIMYFFEVTIIAMILGTQTALRPVSSIVLIIILLQFWRVGEEFRTRERAAKRAAEAAERKKEG